MSSATSSIAIKDVQISGQSTWIFKSVGLALVTLLPALFWTALIATAGRFLGVTFAPAALLATGAAITLFLAAVCAPIMAQT